MSFKKIKQCDVCGDTIQEHEYSLSLCLTGTLPLDEKRVYDIDNKFNHVCVDCVKELNKVLSYSQTIRDSKFI